uniref:DNA replication helicase n=1 Tax=Palisada intermedia TaxID=397057 RepID=UPI00286C5B2D|nr:DNA replication helicase [Palisada intermedia]WKW95625.1 DNA replication helicase [Palisada intermedia]
MSQVYIKKFIPQNYLAEEILLGSIIIYPKSVIYVKNYIKKDFFFLESHTIIYINLTERINKQFNIIQLIYLLKSKSLLKKIGGLKKIINIMRQSQIFINSSKISNYIEKLIHILSSNYIKRLIIQYGYNMTKLGYISKISNQYLYTKLLSYLKFLEKEITKNQQKNKNITSIKQLISIKLLQLKHPIVYNDKNKKNNESHTKFGFKKLDSITNGLPPGNLVVIAGRPSIGKTSFAINIAYNVFFYQKSSICIFSLEMSTKEILNKFLCISCNINIGKKNKIKLKTEDWKKVLNVCKKLIHNNIYINDKNNLKINDIERITKTLIKNQSINLIIIDYLQLIGSSNEENQKVNRSQELGYITRRLKLLSQLLKLPVLVLSQLNRNIEIRSNKEPILSDLKESGCIKHINNTNLDKCLNIKSINLVKFYILNINNNTENISHKYKYTKTYKNIKFIYLSIKTTLKIINHQFTLELTQNHKYLSGISWKKVGISTKYSKINKKLVKFNDNKKIINKNYIKYILLSKPCKTYDINFNDQFHFLSNYIILHNSIEQDSDIIIMLNNKADENSQNTEKIIDIKVCKNRNGYTGYCKILFKPENMKFHELNSNNVTQISYIE